MIILSGSASEQKTDILETALKKILGRGFDVLPLKVESGIVEQPLDPETTVQGSINRARNAVCAFVGEYDFSVGMEAGLVMIDGVYHLVCVATIFDRAGNFATGQSAPLRLPEVVSERVAAGKKFGEVIRGYRSRENLTAKEQMLAESLIGRRAGFTQAIASAWERINRQ